MRDRAPKTIEAQRLAEDKARTKNWQRWGTYLPERQWGTVREDYSYNSDVWNSFPYEMAQYRAYRWGEDGLLGWTDRQCRLCFSTVLWNGQDRTLKERLFGLSNPEGNHGEDVKEQFYYLDALPTHSYCKALYKYPQNAFPYDQLREENKRRGYDQLEYELLDTGIFDENRYFDVFIEYAKSDVEDMLIRITAHNRGPDAASLAILPQLTLRNNWSWRNLEATGKTRPIISQTGPFRVRVEHKVLGTYRFEPVDGNAILPERLLFTENDSNMHRLNPSYNGPDHFSKDGFDRYLVHGEQNAVKEKSGTKCAFLYRSTLEPGASQTLYLRLVRIDDDALPRDETENSPDIEPAVIDIVRAKQIFETRKSEADDFYAEHIPGEATAEECNVSRQAFAGLLWGKQFYYFIAEQWMTGDNARTSHPTERMKKSEDWRHLFCRDILSMPDKWEYPWFAAWDTAFHMIPMASIDPEFAKNQLLLLLREWYMHPNGQMPAYEFSFGDVNPPVHGWAVWHVYRLGVDENGVGDLDFLERAFQKLMLNFTWWVNRNDEKGRNLFGGGFLGLDNIGVFDRSATLPDGVLLHQADGTAWMGLYCSVMLQIALELAHRRSKAYEDIASKFFEHYIAVIDAINSVGGTGLWDEEEGFYFDQLEHDDGSSMSLKVRSIVGIAPLFAVCIMKRSTVEGLKDFQKRTNWFLQYQEQHQEQLSEYVSTAAVSNEEINGSQWIAIAPRDRFQRILQRVLDESEFLSAHGIRALSRHHHEHPFEVELHGQHVTVRYTPAEGDSGMFGGNSNWRGPVWFPMNMLLINALERYSLVYSEDYRLEYPTGSGQQHTLVEIAEDIARRLVNLFLPDKDGRRPSNGREERYANDPYWKDLIVFSEYFDGDTGRGVGASHQTGWTALAATLIQALYTRREIRNRAQ